MSPRMYWNLALRESRRSTGRIALFLTCIAIGVAAVVVVAGLAKSVTDGVRAEGRKLMAADVTVQGRRTLPNELNDITQEFFKEKNWTATSVQRTDVQEFVSVVLGGSQGSSQLAEVKVISNGYPFYGKLVVEPDRSAHELLAADTIIAAPELLLRLGINVGDSVRVGGADFKVAGKIVSEPDKLTITFTLGPRVFMSPAGVARTALMDRGARVEHRALLKLPDGATAADAIQFKKRIEAKLPEAEYFRVAMFTEAQPALRRGFERIDRYLGLVGLLSLLVGGIGVAQVARVWLASRMDDIAILRCLGITPRQVVVLFVVQVLVLAFLGSALGAALGTGLHWLIPQLLPGLLPEELVHPWQPRAIVRGMGLGLAVALLFTVPILLNLRRVPPVRVLRRDAEPIRMSAPMQALVSVVVIGGIWGAAVLQSQSIKYGSLFTGGLLAATGALAAAAVGVSRLARLLPRDTGGFRLRHGLAHLARPGAATVGAMVALGLGVTFVFATRVVERHLSEQLKSELPGDAPSTFFLDVQTDQWAGVKSILEQEGARGVDSQPIVTARFTSINGTPVSEIMKGVRRTPWPTTEEGRDRASSRRWTLTREQRITYGEQLAKGNRVVAGKFNDPNVPNGVSIQDDFARDLGVGIGSKIVLDVQGAPVELTVTSLRTIDWRTFGINFFLFASPGPLNDAPQQRLAVAQIKASDIDRVQSRIVQQYPNITVIHIRDVMEKVLRILSNLALAVRSLGIFIVVAGVIVLGGTIAATQARRAKEIALLKAVGMTRWDVRLILIIEFALTGTVSAVIGLGAGLGLAWSVLTEVMELPWSPKVSEVVGGLVITTAIAIGAGLLASLRSLRVRPLEALRSE